MNILIRKVFDHIMIFLSATFLKVEFMGQRVETFSKLWVDFAHLLLRKLVPICAPLSSRV